MSHCTLLFPGLLGPAVPLEDLPRDAWPPASELPCLCRLLQRGRLRPRARQSLEHHVLSHLGLTDAAEVELPVARLRMQDTEQATATHLWCLDPVHVRLDREMAYLSEPDLLRLTEREAKALIASLNAHFGDELHIHYHAPQEWVSKLELEVTTTTPIQALGRSVQQVQVEGKDARRWRTLLNEIQMLLHAHPVNLAREESGKLPVNSLWLWGGGELAHGTTSIDIIYADAGLYASAATHAGTQQRELPKAISPETLTDQDCLLVLTFQLDALQRKDVYAWLEGLRILERDYLAPLQAMLRQGKLSRLSLESDTLELELDKRRLGRWWQWPKSVSILIAGLRERYGY